MRWRLWKFNDRNVIYARKENKELHQWYYGIKNLSWIIQVEKGISRRFIEYPRWFLMLFFSFLPFFNSDWFASEIKAHKYIPPLWIASWKCVSALFFSQIISNNLHALERLFIKKFCTDSLFSMQRFNRKHLWRFLNYE